MLASAVVRLLLLLALLGSTRWVAVSEAAAAPHLAAASSALPNSLRKPPGHSGFVAAALTIRPQGNDSNCDFVAVYNGVQNIGGDGAAAYQRARALIPQRDRDYHEGFYTRRGVNGSDLPFSLDNLGTAPEAFVGVYEALGFNAVLLAATPGSAEPALAKAIYERLMAQPGGTFAHLWLTALPFRAARTLTVPETNERVPLLYPYHEVVAFAVPERPLEVVIVDGQVRRPYFMSLARLAQQLRGFNRAVVVSRNAGALADHQRTQLLAAGQPYVTQALGGVYLYAARQLWGASYQLWGNVIGLPLRVHEGERSTVLLPGEFVHFERSGAGEVSLAPLGSRMKQELIAQGVLLPLAEPTPPALPEGMRLWAVAEFGSSEAFERIYGRPLTAEFWLSPDQLQQNVLRGLEHPAVSAAPVADGFVAVLTERAMLVWSATEGVFMAPLGRVYHEQLKHDLGL